MKNWSNSVQGIHTLDYSRTIRFSQSNLNQMLPAIGLKDQGTLLEIGTGPGTLLRRIKEIGYPQLRAHGIDTDPAFVTYAKESTKHLPGLSFSLADALALPFPDETFDYCTSHTVIEHLPTEPFLKEQYRVLRKGGVLSVMSVRPELTISSQSEFISEKEQEYFQKLSQKSKKIKENLEVGKYFLSPSEIFDKIKELGLKDLDISVISYLHYPDCPSLTLSERKKYIHAERISALEYIHSVLTHCPDVLDENEKEELFSLLNRRFQKREEDMELGILHHEFEVVPLVIIKGIK